MVPRNHPSMSRPHGGRCMKISSKRIEISTVVCVADRMVAASKTVFVRPSTTSHRVVPGGRPAGVVRFEVEVVDFFLSAADLLGVPKSVAAIYGVVFASPKPLSFADIAARLDISKGSISQGMRLLREIGAVKEISTAADRVELFLPDLELRKLIARYISSRLHTQLAEGQKRLTVIARKVPAIDHDQEAILRQRLKHLTGWHMKARALLPIARTFLKLGD